VIKIGDERMPMQIREQDPSVRAECGKGSGAQLERYDNGELVPASQRSAESGQSEHQLQRYDDEEVATKPWPPLHS
jgi:hypothetical protein